MRFMRVLGLLLIVAAVSQLVILLIENQGSLAVGMRRAGEAFGEALFIFGVAALVAGAVAYRNRGNGEDFSGLEAGFFSALAVAVIVYAGGA